VDARQVRRTILRAGARAVSHRPASPADLLERPVRPAAVVEAAALGQIDFYLPKPVWSPDEQFHRAITESLAEWWRQQGGHFAAVTVIGKEQSARVTSSATCWPVTMSVRVPPC